MTQIDAVVALVRDVLGAAVIGAYEHGSATLGGLQPTSDLDLLVVLGRPMTDDERGTLTERLLVGSSRAERPAGHRPVELTVVVQAEVRPWRYPPLREYQYGEWLRADLGAGGPPPAVIPDPDLAVLLTMVIAADRAIQGPPPAKVLDPVPAADLRRACRVAAPEVMRDIDGDTRNVILTLTRVWSTLETGEIRSKSAAAEWAVARLPAEHHAVVGRALAMYLGAWPDDDWADLRPQVHATAEALITAIDRVP